MAGPGKKSEGENFRFVALQLCALMGIVYGLQVAIGLEPGFNASSSEWWKFFTSVFGHSDMNHLFNNLFFLGLFGSIYERWTSGKNFLVTFTVSALFANITAFIFFPESFIIGASGGAMGILAALAVYRPNSIGLALGVPLPMWAVLIIYVFTNLAGLTGSTNVAYEAHLFGIVSGAVFGFWLRDFNSKKTEEQKLEEDNWKKKIRDWEEKYMM
jgi:membrane associated rhomboid family serine protease